ncbi:MAG: LacI family DNA-binding transcriptional regulator [Rhizobiaceae bacterium]
MAQKRPDKVTIADVARSAGVSTATAGRVLGEYGYSSAEIRDKVRNSAEQLGYRPNLLARSLITGRTKTIGVVTGDIQSPFYASIVRGISDVARTQGFGVIVTNSDERLDREVEAVQLLLEKQVDGLIVSPFDLQGSHHLHAAVDSGFPVVQIDRMVKHFAADSVTVDNRGAARDCVAFILATGHRRIGMIAELVRSDFESVEEFAAAIKRSAVDTRFLFPSWQRLYGYIEAHMDAGIEFDPTLVPPVRTYSAEAGKKETMNLMRRREPPTALFTADGLMSAAAMDAITSLGMQVPADLSLACFDDLDWMRFSKPGITAIAQPLTEMGETAANLILERINGEAGEPSHLALRPTLTVRGSVVRPEHT